MVLSTAVGGGHAALAATLDGLDDSFNEVDVIRGEAGVKDIGDLPDFIVQTVRIFLTVVVVIAVVMVIWGGFLYITSAGEEDRAKQGKRTILYALIGLVLIGLAAIIVNFVIVAFTT